MPGLFGLRGRGSTHGSTIEARKDRLCREVERLRREGVAAEAEIQRRVARAAARSSDPIERQRALVDVFRDARLTAGTAPLRRFLDQLQAAARSLPDRADESIEASLATLESELAEYREALPAYAAWLRVRAATLPPVRLDKLDIESIRDDLSASLEVGRKLLHWSDLAIRCELLRRAADMTNALEDAADAARRLDAPGNIHAQYAAMLGLLDRDGEAADEYRRAFDLDRDPDMLRRCGSALLNAGRHAEALGAADSTLELDPENVDAAVLRADALRFLGRYEDALAAYRVAASLPDAPDVRGRVVSVLVALGHEAELDEVIRSIVGEWETAPVRAASTLYLAHRYAEALDVARTALARGELTAPTKERLERLLPAFECAVGDAATALPRLDALAADSPSDAGVLECRAIALGELGRLDEAIATIRRAIELEPDKSEYQGTLAMLVRWNGAPGEALEHAALAAEGRPGRPESVASFAECLAQLGRVDDASAALAGLPPTSDSDPHALYAKAVIAAAAGDRSRAAAGIAAASAIRPEMRLRVAIDPVLRGLEVPASASGDDAGRPASRLAALDEPMAPSIPTAFSGRRTRLDPGDRMVIEQLRAAGAHLTEPREVAHWLYFGDAAGAEQAARQLRTEGFTVETARVEARGDWSAVARHRLVVSEAGLPGLRARMEWLADELGGEYDGWETSIEP